LSVEGARGDASGQAWDWSITFLGAHLSDLLPGAADPANARRDVPPAHTWLATAGVLAAVVAILGLGNVVGAAADFGLDWYADMGTPRAHAPDALQTYAATRLAVFLAAFQVTVLAASLIAARLFRGDRVAFMALSYPKGGIVGALPYAGVLIAAAAIYATIVLLRDRNALLGDILLLADMMRTDAWWMIALAAIVGAPIAEEVLFRGLMFGVLKSGPAGVAGATVITAVVWAAVHAQYSPYGIFGIAMIGLFLAWVREKTGSLFAPVLCHAVYNASIISVMMLVPERFMQMN
jgi:membrane protease YdiL (CAAX protease family)